jgi:hypothetical protein
MISKITLLFAASFVLIFLSVFPAAAETGVNPNYDLCNQPGANNSNVFQEKKINGQKQLY